jgi:predicted TIM-barrel fold metal-dependent hydrolase
MEIIDAHVHLGLKSFLKSQPDIEHRKLHAYRFPLWNEVQPQLQAMDALNIIMSVVFPFPFPEIATFLANDYILECHKNYSGRFFPFGLIHPNLVNLGLDEEFVGYKQHMVYQDYDFKELTPIYQIISEKGKVLYIHLPFSEKVAQIEKLLSITPKLKIVIAHMGRKYPDSSNGVKEVLSGLRKYENIIFETSNIGDSTILPKAINIVGEDRVCFGSDCPFSDQDRMQDIIEHELKIIIQSKVSTEAMEKILSKNIRYFLER